MDNKNKKGQEEMIKKRNLGSEIMWIAANVEKYRNC